MLVHAVHGGVWRALGSIGQGLSQSRWEPDDPMGTMCGVVRSLVEIMGVKVGYTSLVEARIVQVGVGSVRDGRSYYPVESGWSSLTWGKCSMVGILQRCARMVSLM